MQVEQVKKPRDERNCCTRFFYVDWSVFAQSVLLVFVWGFLQIFPMLLKEYMPMVMTSYLTGTMMMLGAHYLSHATGCHTGFLALHLVTSALSIFMLIVFLVQSSISYPSGEQETVEFNGVYYFSQIVGSLATVLFTTEATGAGTQRMHSWWDGEIAVAAVYLGWSFIHLLASVISLADKKRKSIFYYPNGADDPRFWMMLLGGTMMFVAFTQCMWLLYTVFESIPVLNPTYNQNMILIYSFVCCFFLVIPSSNRSKVDSEVLAFDEKQTYSQQEVVIFGYLSPVQKLFIAWALVLWVTGLVISAVGLGIQYSWLNDNGIAGVLDADNLQSFLEYENTFNFTDFINTDTLTLSSANGYPLNVTSIMLWTRVDMAFSATYLSVGIFCLIASAIYLRQVLYDYLDHVEVRGGRPAQIASRVRSRLLFPNLSRQTERAEERRSLTKNDPEEAEETKDSFHQIINEGT